ncbi:metallophosphoesterase family protein [Escherichia coli]|uniref:metallophosphoesterase family protein n=1 Tax=Escherichia coli TaxID=562 RepID=UPI0039BF541E
MTPSIFFTSDTHFDSERTWTYSRRPFASVADMNQHMLKAINKLPKNSVLWHLGDWGKFEFVEAIRSDIQVQLVLGNWDEDACRATGLSFEAWRDKLLGMGFAAVYEHPLVLPISNDESYWLCHKPSERNPGYFNLFGHIHRCMLAKANGLNVGVDQHFYTPISLDTVRFWRNAIENHYDEEVWME